MRERTTDQIIRQSADPEALLDALKEADDTDLIDTLKPEIRREVEESVRVRSMGSRGLGGFSL
ncbi:MAG: hypothetical protein WAV04_00485 [Candidatus Microsaccharimonas sp.]|jgi:hypothetical protein